MYAFYGAGSKKRVFWRRDLAQMDRGVLLNVSRPRVGQRHA
jgi:hypothetical protein